MIDPILIITKMRVVSPKFHELWRQMPSAEHTPILRAIQEALNEGIGQDDPPQEAAPVAGQEAAPAQARQAQAQPGSVDPAGGTVPGPSA